MWQNEMNKHFKLNPSLRKYFDGDTFFRENKKDKKNK